MAEEDVILVVRGGTEVVSPSLRCAIEPFVDNGEVVIVDDHAAIGIASPSNDIKSVGMGGVRVDSRQTVRLCAGVLREECDVREGGVPGAQALGDVVGGRGVPAAVAVKSVRVVVNVEASWPAERVD